MSPKKILKREFWVTNTLPNKDVSLADLALTIRAGESRNLLDSKRYKYTIEQLEKSIKSGSLYKKRSYIKVRDVAPRLPVKPGLYIAKGPNRLGQQLRSNIEIKDPKYAELDFDEEEKKRVEEVFASDYADAAAYDDHRPALAVDKKYTEEKKEDED